MNTLTTPTRAQALPATTKFALFGASLLSFIAIQDAITHGITGHYSRASDDHGTTLIWLVANLAHGVTYVGVLVVLLVEARRIDAGSRVRKAIRWVLVASFVALAIDFTIIPPVLFAIDSDLDPVPGWLAAFEVLLIGFLVQFPAALALGFAIRKVPGMKLASNVLVGVLAAAAFTALLAVVAQDFAHPAYLEATVVFGIALLGVRRS